MRDQIAADLLGYIKCLIGLIDEGRGIRGRGTSRGDSDARGDWAVRPDPAGDGQSQSFGDFK